MLLAVDVGNSETTIGVFDRDKLGRTWRLATRQQRTADEYALSFSGLLALEDLSFDRNVTGVAIASVVPAVTQALEDMVERYFHFDPLIVQPGIKTGVPILIDNPKEVGADRIVNSVAAQALYGGPAVVVDLGTATTFDILSEAGEYIGGAIAPGIEMWSESLVRSTAQLKRVPLIWPKRLVGRSTTEALQSGIVIGFTSFVAGMIARFRQELGPEAKTVMAGGLAASLAPHLSDVDVVEPWLTLRGLQILYERNAG
ncbi:MAG TPA: type III pantothenate kinase [Actinomycetota bacterium]|nr:type III pantothenate kinase [Actinomycetota bacterium]